MAREAIELPAAHEALAQAARELLLVQSSDWQFIISTGAVADYGIRRFNGHADACDRLFGAIEAGACDRRPNECDEPRPRARARRTICFRTCWNR